MHTVRETEGIRVGTGLGNDLEGAQHLVREFLQWVGNTEELCVDVCLQPQREVRQCHALCVHIALVFLHGHDVLLQLAVQHIEIKCELSHMSRCKFAWWH